MLPQFQGGSTTHAQATVEAKERAMGKREDYAAQQMQAVETMTARYEQELADKR